VNLVTQMVLALLVSGVFIWLVAFYGARLAERKRAADVVQQLTAHRIRAIQRHTLRQLVITAQRTDLMNQRARQSGEIIEIEPDDGGDER
jgi:Flp pilus assembly protein TadB